MSFQSGIVTSNAIIVTVDNRVYNAQSDHPNFKKLRQAYKDGSVEEFIEAYDVEKAIMTYVDNGEQLSSNIKIVNGEILYRDTLVHNQVVDTIQQMMSEDFNIGPMVQFLENLMLNPSHRSVNELWQFIEAMGLTITEDGCFLAYKSVNSNYMDKYSGTINNKPGATPDRLPRNEVDDNPNNHCSTGYHVGALPYAGPGGWYNGPEDKVVICKINPADVVSVPVDHSSQKLRCCYYESVGEFEGELKSAVYSGQVGDSYATQPPRPQEPTFVDAEDLLIGECYICDYEDIKGVTKTRYFMVEEEYAGRYVVELLEPELRCGEYRNFIASGMHNAMEWDGVDPEDNPCDYCIDNDCDECDL